MNKNQLTTKGCPQKPQQASEVLPVEQVEQIEDVVEEPRDSISISRGPWNLLEQWLSGVIPCLRAGGKAAALILAIGVVAIPLTLSSNVLVASILSVGVIFVAIVSIVTNF